MPGCKSPLRPSRPARFKIHGVLATLCLLSACKSRPPSAAALSAAEHLPPPADTGAAAGASAKPAIRFLWSGHNGEWASRQIAAALPAMAALAAAGFEVDVDSWTTRAELVKALADPEPGVRAIFLSALGDGEGDAFAWCDPGSFDCPPPYHMKIAPVGPEAIAAFGPRLAVLDFCVGNADAAASAWKAKLAPGAAWYGAPNGVAPETCTKEAASGFLQKLVDRKVVPPAVWASYEGFAKLEAKPAAPGDSVLFIWGGLEGGWTDPQVRRAVVAASDFMRAGRRVVFDTWARREESLAYFKDPRSKAIFWSSHGDGQGNLWAWCDAESLLAPEADCTSSFRQKVVTPEAVTLGANLDYVEICACYSGLKTDVWTKSLAGKAEIVTHDKGVDTTWCQEVAGKVFPENVGKRPR